MDTAYERLSTRIRDQIVSGELRPGDRLPAEHELTEHYHVSRNTAREAIRALSSQGLIQTRRGVTGGTFVSVPSPEGLTDLLYGNVRVIAAAGGLREQDLHGVWSALVTEAAIQAALHADTDALGRLQDLLVDDDEDAAVPRALAFYQAMAHAGGNPLLAVLVEALARVLAAVDGAGVPRDDRTRADRNDIEAAELDAQLTTILTRLAAHDAQGAAAAVQAALFPDEQAEVELLVEVG